MTGDRRCRVLIGVVITLALVPACSRTRDEDDAPKKAPASPRPARTPSGDPIVHVDATAQARIGLRMEAAVSQRVQPDLLAYGRLEADPARTFVLRAPVSGTLHVTADHEWPRLGESLPDGDTIGALAPRLSPAEQIGLTNQLTSARADLAAASAALTAANAAYERARVLNADNKNVSDRTVEEAASRKAAEEAHFKTATESVALLDVSLNATNPTATRPLTLERGGEVIEVLAQPGEAVEPGAPLVRVANFDRLLARVDLPVGVHVAPTVSTARIIVVGYEDMPMDADRLGVVSAADAASPGASVLFQLRRTLFGLRPGIAVTARIPANGPPQTGIAIPASAIVRVDGQPYVFVQTGTDEFVRKAVALDQPTDTGYLTTTTVAVGDRVVVQGAQMLLSEEFKSRISTEG